LAGILGGNQFEGCIKRYVFFFKYGKVGSLTSDHKPNSTDMGLHTDILIKY